MRSGFRKMSASVAPNLTRLGNLEALLVVDLLDVVMEPCQEGKMAKAISQYRSVPWF